MYLDEMYLILDFVINRSSHPDVFCQKGVLKNFVKFTGKHLCHLPHTPDRVSFIIKL